MPTNGPDAVAAREAAVEAVARMLVEQRGCGAETLHQFEPSYEPWPVDETQQSTGADMQPTTISLTRAWRKRVPDAQQIYDLLASLMPRYVTDEGDRAALSPSPTEKDLTDESR